MIYQPLDKWYDHADDSMPLVFLAGPIQGTWDWQSKAMELISTSNKPFNFANPRRIEGGELFKDLSKNDAFIIQVEWQTAHLRLASSLGGIMFWLAKETEVIPNRAYAQTSRFEIGEWIQNYKYRKLFQPDREPLKLIVGIEDGFYGAKYIRHRVSEDLPDFKIYSTLEETCNAVVETI